MQITIDDPQENYENLIFSIPLNTDFINEDYIDINEDDIDELQFLSSLQFEIQHQGEK